LGPLARIISLESSNFKNPTLGANLPASSTSDQALVYKRRPMLHQLGSHHKAGGID
jgi:hypothetical protein